MENRTCAVILAAGEGKRMKTSGAKAMCEVLFKPMIDWVLDAVRAAGIHEICVVTGHCGEQLCAHLPQSVQTVCQAERLGTGHAVKTAAEFIARAGGDTLVLNGDAPLMDAETIASAYRAHMEAGNAATVISARVNHPQGYGRIVLNHSDGTLQRIVEEKDATDEEKGIYEVNSGAFWFNSAVLLESLNSLSGDNAQGEYYLTDTIGILKAAGKRAGAYAAPNANVVLGANDRIQLMELNQIANRQILYTHMANGVDIPCTDGVLIGPDVSIGRDTRVLPNTLLTGNSRVGAGCTIGPNSKIIDSTIGTGASLDNVNCERAEVADGADIGPFVHIRPNSEVGRGVHLGNFVEVKNSVIGEGTKVSHLTYVGDSDVGARVNFGCGCVTVNYDGNQKHRTTIGDHAFIGCNTNLVAPVTVEEYGYTAAGSTITQDVPALALGIARARQVNKEGWVARRENNKTK